MSGTNAEGKPHTTDKKRRIMVVFIDSHLDFPTNINQATNILSMRTPCITALLVHIECPAFGLPLPNSHKETSDVSSTLAASCNILGSQAKSYGRDYWLGMALPLHWSLHVRELARSARVRTKQQTHWHSSCHTNVLLQQQISGATYRCSSHLEIPHLKTPSPCPGALPVANTLTPRTLGRTSSKAPVAMTSQFM